MSWTPERALLIAAGQVGVRESRRNGGEAVDAYLRSVGLEPGQPWCAAFVAWCLIGSGVSRSRLPVSAGAVRSWRGWAEREGRLVDNPRRGDLFFWLNENGTGHIGFVRQTFPGVIGTIEGNTDSAGSREGDGVYRRLRTLRSLASRHRHGFVTLQGLA